MGKFDIPASVNYVLNETKQDKLAAFFGYSLGCTLFYIAAIENPKLNDQIDMVDYFKYYVVKCYISYVNLF